MLKKKSKVSLKKVLTRTVLGALFLGFAGAMIAFPLWLDAPTRKNAFDPKSPFGTATPTATPVLNATQIFQAGETQTAIAQATLGVPTNTAVPTLTPTNTPVFTPTNTATAVPASDCSLAAGSEGNGLITDFEQVGGVDASNNSRCDGCDGYFWYGSSGVGFDADPAYDSTTNPDPWAVDSATLNSDPAAGTNGSSTYAGCFYGQVGKQASPWPYVEFQMPMAAGNAAFDISGISRYRGVKFDYRAKHVGDPLYTDSYQIRVGTKQVSDAADYAQFTYSFTPTDTNWHTMTVYFRGYGKGQPEFERPSWGAQAVRFDLAKVLYVEFMPSGSETEERQYDICVDNITFNVAAPPAPPSTLVGTLENFEGTLTNPSTYDDGLGSTISQAITSSQAYAGSKSLAIAVSAPANDPGAPSPYGSTCTGCWGAGVHVESASVVDASTATHLRFRVKPVLTTNIDVQTMDLTVKLTEENVAGTDASNERWTSSARIVKNADSSCWTTIYVPISSFDTEDDVNGQCSPSCASTGNGALDLSKMKGVDIQFNTRGNTIGNVYVDDIQFVK